MTIHHVVRVESTGSTNSDLMRALTDDPDAWHHLSVLVADVQTAGRGRNGNSWRAPAGCALTCSIVLDPGPIPATWVPLVAGLAVSDALAEWVPTRLKWPNDVVIDEEPSNWGFGRKIAGVLCELHPSGRVVAGIGVNCTQRPKELPVPWAASLASILPSPPDPDTVLNRLVATLDDVWRAWEAEPDEVRERYRAASAVIGREVAVALPGGTRVTGIISDIDDDGVLALITADGPERIVAGDVFQLRPASPRGDV